MKRIPDPKPFPLGLSGIEWAQRNVVVDALRQNHGCVKAAARTLQCHRNTIYNIVRKTKVEPCEFALWVQP